MKNLIGILSVIFLLAGCVKNNPEPAWLKVNEWKLLGNQDLTNVEGELSHNFTDAWVYVNDKIVGVFELPFKIPVLQSGSCNIKIFPAIRNNGVSATKKIYPFVEGYEINASLLQKDTLILQPVTKYNSKTKFWIEDFEDAVMKIKSLPNSSVSMSVGNDPKIAKWNRYGLAQLNPTATSWLAYTIDELALPKGQEIYLELDYYNTNALVTGVIALTNNDFKNNIHVQINAQKPDEVTWKKIYIDLREIVSYSSGANTFLISLQAALDNGDADGLIVLDNIKVVHF